MTFRPGDEIADLIKRVEAATGPDPSIDAAVTAALHGATVKPYPPTDDFGPRNKWQFWTRDGQHFLGSEHKFKVAPVTASVDAVIGLIGETIGIDEAEWYVQRPTVDGPYHAAVRCHTSKPTDDVQADAPTPALSLLLAFLRAWEQRGDG